jgi:O-antigen ligase
VGNKKAVLLGAFVGFAALAGGAHDLWAATIVYASVVLLAAAVVVERSWPADGPGVAVDFGLPLTAVFLAFCLSYRQAVNPGESRMALMDWTAAMALFMLARDLFKSDSSTSAFLSAIVPVLWIQLGAVLLEISNPNLHRLKEAVGTMNNANIQTAFFLPWVPVLARRALDDKAKRLYWLSGLAAAAAGILILSSSTGLLCLGLGALLSPRLFSGRAPGRKYFKWIALAALSLACVLAVLLWKKFGAEPGGIPTYKPSARIEWWMTAFNMWKARPWLGVGLGNFPSAFRAYKTGTSENTLYAHGILMELLSETGVVGLAAAGFFAAAAASRGWKYRREISARAPMLAGVISLLVFSLVSVSLEYLANLMAGAVLAGMAFAPLARTTVKPRRSALIALAAAAAALMPFIWAPLSASRQVVAASRERAAGRIDDAVRLAQGAVALDPVSWEPRQESARAHAARYAASGRTEDLDAAVREQQAAVSRNVLSAALRRELDLYSDARASIDKTR